MKTLLLEIGTEEIPAGYIAPALKALSSRLLQKMTDAHIGHGATRTFGTPRRLAVTVENVADRQRSLTDEIIGPPAGIGFDENGQPTLAAKKFAEKTGSSLKALKIKKTDRGLYLSVKKTEKGSATRTVLQTILPEVILSTPFPKTMRWGCISVSFARPIHSILALLGGQIVPFVLVGIKSNRCVYGHSFMHPSRIKVSHPDTYVQQLRKAFVLVDGKERRERVEDEIETAAKGLGGKVLTDGALVDTVNNLVEYPVAVAGAFEEAFLELPREILITAMREHQKYFALTDENENLMPCFIAMNNTVVTNRDLSGKGHERVIRARLKDAQFFYQSDLEVPFNVRIEKLKKVLFQARLGSMYEKIMRVQELGAFLADAGEYDSKIKEQVMRAALLCKADLVSQVAVEFPKLQGIMGRIYATVAGEPPLVATAIEEHYRPTYSGGPLPETMTGAILSIADKIDSICGCFCVGLVPTGASDPYALRRQGIGIAQIMLYKKMPFSIKEMIEKGIGLFGEKKTDDKNETGQKIYAFLKRRMVHLLSEEGFSKDVIAAVIHVSVDHIPEVWKRVQALERLRSAPDFEPLAIAFKRVVNIIKQAGRVETTDVDEKQFQHGCESDLYNAYKKVQKRVRENLKRGDFSQALLDIAGLRKPVDVFFDGVMVMAEDIKIRHNRLAVLGRIAALFGKFADFSKISA